MKKSEKQYIAMPLINGHYISFIYLSSARKGSWENFMDAQEQIIAVYGSKDLHQMHREDCFLDTPENREQELVNEHLIIDCRRK